MEHNPFDSLVSEYESWFVQNKTLFQSELLALKQVIPIGEKDIEIGIGSGIFAEQLGIHFGIDPSENMMEYARKRGLEVQISVAEELPYDTASFDYAVFITSICFVENPQRTIEEAHRILKNEGVIIIAFIDKDTPFGKFLDEGKSKSRFYKNARFFSTQEIVSLLETTNFRVDRILQTLENPGSTIIEEPTEGYGKGSFVVIKGTKNLNAL